VNEVKIHRLSFSDGGNETIPLSVISSNIFRLEGTPVWEIEPELYFGDSIEVEPQTDGTLRFVRLVERGQFRHYRWDIHQQFIDSSQYGEFTAAVEAAGGQWERVMGGFLFVHIPSASSFDAEGEFKRSYKSARDQSHGT